MKGDAEIENGEESTFSWIALWDKNELLTFEQFHKQDDGV